MLTDEVVIVLLFANGTLFRSQRHSGSGKIETRPNPFGEAPQTLCLRSKRMLTASSNTWEASFLFLPCAAEIKIPSRATQQALRFAALAFPSAFLQTEAWRENELDDSLIGCVKAWFH